MTRTGKNGDGEIVELCHPGALWSPRSKEGAIRDIQVGSHSYFVKVGRKRIEIAVIVEDEGFSLRTDPEWTAENNLLNLPDCP